MRHPSCKITAISLCLAACCLAAADEPVEAISGDVQEKNRPLVTVGPDTTVLTEPLDDEGYVDFQAHANAVMSKGVTPENNAAVLLWQAYGPANIKEEHRAEFFTRLGIDTLPEVGDYYRGEEAFAGDVDLADLQDQFIASISRPWTKKEFPSLARWLAANEKPLALAVEASERPKLYQPLLGGPPLLFVLLPHLQESRDVARALVARAMLHAGEGDIEAAQRDLTAVHRLAMLHDQGLTLIDALVAIAIDSIALNAEKRLALSGKLTAKQARELQSQIAALPPMTPMKDRIDKLERYSFIDGVTMIARDPKRAGELEVGPAIAKLLSLAIDWNETLRYGNRWYDKLVDALDKPTYRLQKESYEALEDELRDVAQQVKSGKWATALLLTFGEKRKILLGKTIGEIMVVTMLPAVAAAHKAELMHIARRDLVATSLALAAYKKDHGKYPDELAKLVPECLKEVPQDIFSGEPAKYTSGRDDYLLYSVGPNLADDGGFGWGDDVEFDVDDVAVGEGKKQQPADE